MSQSSTIDLNVSLNSQLHIEDTSKILDNPYGNWIINNIWNEDPDTGCSLTVSNLFAKTAELLVSQIGLLSYGTEVTNNSDISISSDIQGKISAYSTMNLTSDNKTPTDEELAQVHAPDFDSFNWELNVATIAAAGLSASGGLIGMAGLNEGETEATVINNGNISISGAFDISQESDYNFSTNIEEFETEFSNGVPLTLKIDSSSVLALTNINKTVYAAGLYGISSAGKVSLINNGTIFINTDENYNAAGIVAQVAQDGKIFASNMGKIDLSNAKGKITHQFYGRIKDNGQIEIGDWLLDLNDIQNIVPFALAVDENGGGRKQNFVC